MKKRSDPDLGMAEKSSIVRVLKNPSSYIYDIYLSEEIEDSNLEYVEAFRALDEGTEDDLINIHLGNFGGSCQTGIRLSHAMKNSKSHVCSIVEAGSYSMAAIIALSGNELILRPTTYLMFHNYSGGVSGKGGEIETAAAHDKIFNRDYMYYFCTPFLTKSEIEAILKDQDIYIRESDPKTKARLTRHFRSQ